MNWPSKIETDFLAASSKAAKGSKNEEKEQEEFDDWLKRAHAEFTSVASDIEKMAWHYDKFWFQIEVWLTGQPIKKDEVDQLSQNIKYHLKELARHCHAVKNKLNIKPIF